MRLLSRRLTGASFHSRVFTSSGPSLGGLLAMRVESFDGWSHSFASAGRIQGVGDVPLELRHEKRRTVRPTALE